MDRKELDMRICCWEMWGEGARKRGDVRAGFWVCLESFFGLALGMCMYSVILLEREILNCCYNILLP